MTRTGPGPKWSPKMKTRSLTTMVDVRRRSLELLLADAAAILHVALAPAIVGAS